MPLGPTELIIILVIVLVIFGAKRLPELGKGLGSGMKEFKDSVSGGDKSDSHSLTERADLPPVVPNPPAPEPAVREPEAAPRAEGEPPAAPPRDAG